MDELCATLRRISKFLRRQRVDTSTASVSRLEDGHLFARARKLAGGHQARSARADDEEMSFDWWFHLVQAQRLVFRFKRSE